MEYEEIARQFRKKVLNDVIQDTARKVSYTQNDIIKILPHRKPFLLLDSIDSIDLANQSISGTRYIDPKDPVFEGHFPSAPLYPGVLQVEMMGQLGICLHYFVNAKTVDIAQTAKAVNVRVVKINHALFQHEIYPGDTVTVAAKQIYDDDYLCTGIGQIIKDGKICALVIAELHIL